ncbi:4465_t:CDS:2 [Paraglomus brasilianum]|uniref:4465_t:CDS:1 n=1 Tax=Paraglomus brasilianum TaxID=144538 RepID=A0A9N9D8A0_9GLOM|nr:4465_t:CDS:2 [Paraglomus brasilianum]
MLEFSKIFDPRQFRMTSPSYLELEDPIYVQFVINITDDTFNSSQAFVTSADINLIDNETLQNLFRDYKSGGQFNQQLVDVTMQSSYQIFYRQNHFMFYTRSVREIIKPNILDNIGYPPGTISEYLLTTEFESGPIAPIISPSLYATIFIRPRTLLVKTETEKRTYTLLNALALLGGAWSGAIGLYVFLFGSKSLNPWGCVQSYCCCFVRKTRSQLRESFPTIQSSVSLMTSSLSDLPTSSNTSFREPTLEQRLDALELLLKEYVIDQTYLENVNGNKYSNRLSELIGNWVLEEKKY